MNDTDSPIQEAGTPVIDGKGMAFIVYLLYLVGFFFPLTALIGVVIAHVSGGKNNRLLDSHYAFQIRTFWYGVATTVAGFILSFVLIGYLVFVWWIVWTLVRVIRGLVLLNEGKPVANPRSLMFG